MEAGDGETGRLGDWETGISYTSAILNSLFGALNRRETRRARIRNSQFSINPRESLMPITTSGDRDFEIACC
jgi:hypothetical protein